MNQFFLEETDKSFHFAHEASQKIFILFSSVRRNPLATRLDLSECGEHTETRNMSERRRRGEKKKNFCCRARGAQKGEHAHLQPKTAEHMLDEGNLNFCRRRRLGSRVSAVSFQAVVAQLTFSGGSSLATTSRLLKIYEHDKRATPD